MLELVDRVGALSEQGLRPPPGRLPIAELRGHAQLPARAEVAALTRRIAALAQGILAMERCDLFDKRLIMTVPPPLRNSQVETYTRFLDTSYSTVHR